MRDRRVFFGGLFSCWSSSSLGTFGRVGIGDGTCPSGSLERTRGRVVKGSPGGSFEFGSLDDRRV